VRKPYVRAETVTMNGIVGSMTSGFFRREPAGHPTPSSCCFRRDPEAGGATASATTGAKRAR